MAKLIPSLDLIRRTVRAEAAYTLSRLQVLERLPGNPVGVAYRQLEDGAIAFMARHLPLPSFNNVVGLRAGQEHHVEPLVRWYRDNGVKAQFALVPGSGDAKLGRELARARMLPVRLPHLGDLRARSAAADTTGVAIETVATAPACWRRFWIRHGRGLEDPRPTGVSRPTCAAGSGNPAGRSIWPASMPAGRRPASSTSTIGSAIAPDAATDPAFRGRGLQTAMLRRRIADARTRRRRLCLQRRRVSFNQPPQHGAGGPARAVRPVRVEEGVEEGSSEGSDLCTTFACPPTALVRLLA
jgi:GNAT superfamily N-acetyltransferase